LFVLLWARRDRRLRLRDEFASAIGVPVLASMEAGGCKSTGDWKRLLEKYRPSTVDSWNLRRLLHRLAPTDAERRQLSVAAFVGDGPALSVGVELAKSAAALGMQVTLLPGAQPSLDPLRAACKLAQPNRPVQEPFTFEARTSGPEFSTVRLAVAVVAVQEAKPELPSLAGPVLFAVSCGFATAESLARVVLAASDAGYAIDGIVVVNPEPGDGTVGLVPQTGQARPLRYAGNRANPDRSLGQPR
jgi:hypothetical protein